VILIPVPEVDRIVRPFAERQSPERRFPTTVAHISLCDFKPTDQIDDEAIQGLSEFFATVPPFEATLDRIERFSSGLAFLAPEPRAAFDKLIARVSSRYPETPPYGGQFDVVVPHVSLYLPRECSDGDLDPVRLLLPVRFHVSEARLVDYTPTICRDLASFSLAR
jgi:hypothetical protein